MYEVELFGIQVQIAQSIMNMWLIMAALTMIALGIYIHIKRGGFKMIPEDNTQLVIEAFVEFIYNISRSTMGERNVGLAPYIGTISIFILLSNIVGLLGIRKVPTTDYSVALGFALTTFIFVQTHQFRSHGIKSYFGELLQPYPVFLPLNILEKITPVLSMSLRLFGNITAGVIIMELAYSSLRDLSVFAMAFVPLPLHFYFDIFDGFLQTMVFVILTMELTAKATAVEE
ncbi:MAG TPA: F0F1 ATP synthase subunit A [Patescibacteria group bacterium]|nr:F0F1 ATP synthase subunit A [Patescibacteria group bacterium]